MALTDFASDLGQLVARQKPGTAMTPEMKALYAQRKWQNMHYAEYFWYIVLAVIGILAVVNVMDKGYNSWRKYRTLRQRLYDNQLPHGELRPVRNGEGGVRASRIPLAIGNWLRIACYRWTFPFTDATLADAFINLAYIALMLLWSFVASRNCNMKLWASRTGAIASSQVPLLPVLAAKNNIITLVTGISHEKMYALHRAAGRIMLLGIWLHSVGKVLSGSNFEAMHAKAALVGLICFTLTFILSLGPIRKFWYEWFLASHCILIAGYFIGGWYHAAHFEKGYWFWSAMVLWALDRVLRVARTIWIARPGNKMVTREATIELISEDTVAMRMVRPVSWKAGAHAFIIVPSISGNPLEAHPFTISTIPNPPTREATESSSQHEMTFIIRGRKGFTGRLRNQAAMARQTGRNVVNAYIDGPYGVPPDLTTFSTCVLIAGGSGVSYTIAMLEELIQKARKGTSACQRIVFIWSIRDEAHIAWIYGQLLAALACVPPELSVSIRIFVTRAPGFLGRLPFENGMQRQPSMDSEKYTGKEKTSLTAYPEVRIEYGRPNIEQLAFEEACMARGAMSIDASGPAPLIHSVRAASRSSRIAGAGAIARGMPSITLHVEMFSM